MNMDTVPKESPFYDNLLAQNQASGDRKRGPSKLLVCSFTGTLQGINISHLGKRKIIFKMPFLGDMLVPWRVCFPS